MIRLAEARARVELRETVTEQDAMDVIEIMKFSLWDTYEDSKGNVVFERSQHGSGTSKSANIRKMAAELQRLARSTGNNRFSKDALQALCQQLGVVRSVEMIDTLNMQGYLINKGNRIYELCI